MNLWTIPCRYDPVVRECVDSIREHNPADQIMVVDSCSPDTSYLDELDIDYRVTGNEHYCPGAWRHALDIEADGYAFIHDSCVLTGPVEVPPVGVLRVIGPESRHQIDPVMQAFVEAHSPIGLPDTYHVAFGPILFFQPDELHRFAQTGFFDLQPTNRSEANGCERIAGISLFHLGMPPTLVGNIDKVFRDRP